MDIRWVAGMSPIPGLMPWPGFAATAAPDFTSIVQAGSWSNPGSTATTVTMPSSVSSGDLLVYCVVNSSNIFTNPSGWTAAANISGGPGAMRIGYKISDGTEGSTNVTVASSAVRGAVLSVRCDKAIASVPAAGGGLCYYTSGNPPAQVILSGARSAPVVVFGVSIRGIPSWSPTYDGSVRWEGSGIFAWKAFLTSPADVSIDVNDGGSPNCAGGCWIELAG